MSKEVIDNKTNPNFENRKFDNHARKVKMGKQNGTKIKN